MRRMNGKTDDSLERICELADLGARRAADALAALVGRPIQLAVPRVLTLERLESLQANSSDTGIFFEVEGGPGGVLAVLFPAEALDVLLEAVLGAPEPGRASTQMESALREVGNILASHALSAVADAIGARVLPSVPVLALEEAESVLAAFAADASGASRELRIESELADSEGALRGVLVWLPA